MTMYTSQKQSRFFLSGVRRHALLLMISLLLIMMLVSCGRKGPVRPKLQSLPSAPQDVTLQQKGVNFLLGWTRPEQNQDGSKAEDLTRFRILRLVYAAKDDCPTCRDPEETVATIDLSYPEPAQRIGKRFYWFDGDVSLGYGYLYRIVPITIGRETGEWVDIHRTIQPPPPPPINLEAVSGDQQITLSWQAPALPEGVETVGYNLYRRYAHLPFSPVPINPKPITETTMRDYGLQNGQAYEYRVSILVRIDLDIVESAPTPDLLITPQKR
jgi:predicted small lipoprotein YifL